MRACRLRCYGPASSLVVAGFPGRSVSSSSSICRVWSCRAGCGPDAAHRGRRCCPVSRWRLGAAEALGRTFEIGGPEAMRYIDMMRRVAIIEGRRNLVLQVPSCPRASSARWLSLVTECRHHDRTVPYRLDDHEVIVHDDAIRGCCRSSRWAMTMLSWRHWASGPRRPAHEKANRWSSPSDSRDRRSGHRAAWSVAVQQSRFARVLRFDTGVAGTWLGGAWSPGRCRGQRAAPPKFRSGTLLVVPVAVGSGMFGLFYLVALAARRVPELEKALTSVSGLRQRGSTPLVLSTTLANAREEVFFRGAVYARSRASPRGGRVHRSGTCSAPSPLAIPRWSSPQRPWAPSSRPTPQHRRGLPRPLHT